jgi:hypothetical protein
VRALAKPVRSDVVAVAVAHVVPEALRRKADSLVAGWRFLPKDVRGKARLERSGDGVASMRYQQRQARRPVRGPTKR